MIPRRASRKLKIGSVTVGGNAPIAVQSMTKTDTRDVNATVNQVKELQECGCEIVRIAVPDKQAAESIPVIKKNTSLPIIADIHFDYRLALASLQAGVDGIRLNPGNIGGRKQIAKIVSAAKEREIPIRIGVNAGSLPPNFEPELPLVQRMVDIALEQIRLMENLDFNLIKVSLKAFDVPTTVQAYQMLADKIPYPLHLGITEAGLPQAGAIRSAIGIGILLYQGIGDTIRVSLSAHPCQEVSAGYEILKSLGLRQRGATLISCPSCGRAEVDIIPLAEEINKYLQKITNPIKVAVMGCLPKGMPIITNSILKPIENVRTDEYVLTHSCKFRRVRQTFKRYYRGELVEIQPRGFPPFLVTPEHPVRAISRPYICKSKRKFIAVSRALNQKSQPQWVEAGMLPKGWILTYPITKGIEDVENYRGTKVDKDFLTICGYYLSEGSLSGKDGKAYEVHFDFHIKEMPYYLNLMGILNKYGIKAQMYARLSRKTMSIYASSLSLGSMFLELFGKNAGEKHMPQWFLTLPRRKQVHLLKALWEGDGYIGKVRSYWRASYVTISPLLAFQVHQLLLRQGIAASMLTRNAQPGHQRSYAITVTGKYYLEHLFQILGVNISLGDVSQRTQHIIVDDNFLYAPIFRINRIPYEGMVYNLEVTHDHSYVTLGASLHNCVVNGPGEAKDADVGIACGKGKGAIFRKGKVVRTVPEENLLQALMEEIKQII